MTGNWWVRMMNVELGYWPSTLFTTLRESAEYVVWGGHVTSPSGVPGTRHTKTQMGSGHFPDEGFKKACYFRNLLYTTLDSTTRSRPIRAKDLHRYTTKPNCYDLKLAENRDWGVYFYFGGPGFSRKCLFYRKWFQWPFFFFHLYPWKVNISIYWAKCHTERSQ